MSEYADRDVKCVGCGDIFVFSAGQQKYFADKGLQNAPKRCEECRDQRNQMYNEKHEAHGKPPSGRVEYPISCSECGARALVPFEPAQGRDVYCKPCFNQRKAATV